MARYRLYGGGREGEIADELPEGYKLTGTGHGVGSTMENEYPMTAVLIPDNETD